MDIISRLKIPAIRLLEEDAPKPEKLTCVKEIYRSWESNDDGEDMTLYTGLTADGIARRCYLKHYMRDWNGGWSYNETTVWYEISEQVFLQLCASAEP